MVYGYLGTSNNSPPSLSSLKASSRSTSPLNKIFKMLLHVVKRGGCTPRPLHIVKREFNVTKQCEKFFIAKVLKWGGAAKYRLKEGGAPPSPYRL